MILTHPRYRLIRRLTLVGTTMGLIIANLSVHVRAMTMSEQALIYEREIAAYKQTSVKLEEDIVNSSSLQALAQSAQAAGYRTPVGAIKWLSPPTIARR